MIRLHLVSAPFALPIAPSIQLGALKAWVRQSLAEKVETFDYYPNIRILYDVFGIDFMKSFYRYETNFGDGLFFLYFCDKFLPNLPVEQVDRAIAVMNRRCPTPQRGTEGMITRELLDRLHGAFGSWVDGALMPAINHNAVNFVGFTLNYHQLYASMAIARMIEARAKKSQVIFLWGGYEANVHGIGALFKKTGIRGFRVLGEGEIKLERILNRASEVLQSQPHPVDLEQALTGAVPGVVPAQSETEPSIAREVSRFGQVERLETLPLPDFDTYFLGLKDDPFLEKLMWSRYLGRQATFEGTRGCFAKCDFCCLNDHWQGFRRLSGRDIADRVRTLRAKYGSQNFMFVDSVADTWAADFADQVKEEGLHFYLALRVNHPEQFWCKVAAGGLYGVQLGVEALSANLLRKMNKGATVVQNLKAHKICCELGVWPKSNLITHHPKSTIDDVSETERILEQISHLDPMYPVKFYLRAGMPIHDALSQEVRSTLKSDNEDLPPVVASYAMAFTYKIPELLELPKETKDAWDKLASDYGNISERQNSDCTMEAHTLEDGSVVVQDRRHSASGVEYRLRGNEAVIHDLCHEALTLAELQQRTGLDVDVVSTIVDGLLAQQLLLAVDDRFWTLAMRPKECLLRKWGLGSPSS